MDIFVVDDEPVIAETIVAILRMHGYRAETFADGKGAIAALGQVSYPKLLIADYGLPDVTGPELAFKLNEICPGCRIILLTCRVGPPAGLTRLREAGLEYTLLFKPCRPENLLQAVRDNMV